MTPTPRQGALFALILLGAAPAASAQTLDAHAHGRSLWNIAIQDIAAGGVAIDMELIAPAHDIVGFERPARSAADQTAVAEAVATLADGAALFAFPAAAGCTLRDTAVVATQSADHPNPSHHDGDHRGAGHPDTHGDAHGDTHGDAHGDTPDHAEFHARYRFECRDPGAVRWIQTAFFARFANAREIVVQAVTPEGARRSELTPDRPRVSF